VNEVVRLERHDVVAIVTVDSPPVNALSAAVRGGILDCVKRAIADPQAKAIVRGADLHRRRRHHRIRQTTKASEPS